jgi:hypothetical protein
LSSQIVVRAPAYPSQPPEQSTLQVCKHIKGLGHKKNISSKTYKITCANVLIFNCRLSLYETKYKALPASLKMPLTIKIVPVSVVCDFLQCTVIPKPAFGKNFGTTSGFRNKFKSHRRYPKHGKSFRKAFWNQLVFPSMETSKNFCKFFPLKKATRKCQSYQRSDKSTYLFLRSSKTVQLLMKSL